MAVYTHVGGGGDLLLEPALPTNPRGHKINLVTDMKGRDSMFPSVHQSQERSKISKPGKKLYVCSVQVETYLFPSLVGKRLLCAEFKQQTGKLVST